MSPLEIAIVILGFLGGIVGIAMALLPFLVESGERDGIVKTGQEMTDDKA